MASSRHCLSNCSSRSHHLLWALTLVGLAPLLISCGGTSGPSVILVPALIATRTQVRTAEPFRVKVLVALPGSRTDDNPDGTVVISKKRVHFPAGVWITLVSKEELNQ